MLHTSYCYVQMAVVYMNTNKIIKVSMCVLDVWWFIVVQSSGLYPPLSPFQPLPLRQQCSSSNGPAVGYWVLWGINQLTGCHRGGWGSLHWCTGFLIKTSCTNCCVFERLIKLPLWSLEANLVFLSCQITHVCTCANTYKKIHVQNAQSSVFTRTESSLKNWITV